MQYTVNGTARTGEALSVAELVDAEVGSREGVAVAINAQVIPASRWDQALSEGDVVDILTAVQGG
ncbi:MULTISPECIES: sulfur carrier protein ThiS [unclassified Corynebacterium]|uniref:sulfur carrier protein ThiS n=1 Tax=unclassified Corynebacterium TaxID=2624378 RepID=UPI0029C9D1CE|nr:MULTISPECIES: sulfur carrier protein ThiS [unclassified Corynebacterium]WPF65339.1 sulfur carrier protein ThiS [Corynebacterium sp. 22KM0430]WPF67834.1 sulfur carrier protein ThiS [Corynebacterium sp. 21KM1197]